MASDSAAGVADQPSGPPPAAGVTGRASGAGRREKPTTSAVISRRARAASPRAVSARSTAVRAAAVGSAIGLGGELVGHRGPGRVGERLGAGPAGGVEGSGDLGVDLAAQRGELPAGVVDPHADPAGRVERLRARATEVVEVPGEGLGAPPLPGALHVVAVSPHRAQRPVDALDHRPEPPAHPVQHLGVDLLDPSDERAELLAPGLCGKRADGVEGHHGLTRRRATRRRRGRRPGSR